MHKPCDLSCIVQFSILPWPPSRLFLKMFWKSMNLISNACIWWLVELLYWFKASCLQKRLEIHIMRGEIYTSYLSEIPHALILDFLFSIIPSFTFSPRASINHSSPRKLQAISTSPLYSIIRYFWKDCSEFYQFNSLQKIFYQKNIYILGVWIIW